MELFIYPFLLDEQERYVLWFTDAVDGVLTNKNGHIATFSSIETATEFVQDRALSVSSEVSSTLDLRWIAQAPLTPINLDCGKVLDAWNFFVDIAASLPCRADLFVAHDNRSRTTYEKVFWGNNLPAVTPPDERFDPIWLGAEIAEIKAIFESGLELFKANLVIEEQSSQRCD